MKYIYIILLVFIINCSGNKVSNYHGIKKLQTKYEKIEINKMNKNDLIQLIGPPSSISDFNKNKWLYIERLKTNQSIIKLGTQRLKENNILIVELNKGGIIINKKLLNLNDMNDVKYIKNITQKDFKNNNFIYGALTSLREKINAPARNRGK
tara:strand:- start:356 stop:811 length:456 start_codon:yes stop_codon:yes gene_type:complete